MGMFQNSVLKEHLKSIDKQESQKAYTIYKDSFLSKVANIKTSKEEQYQYGFLEDIFVKVLGYTLNPAENFDLTTELKNQTDSKKADGAILKDNKAIAVIELKSTKTKSMDSIVNQAFNYKNNHPTCRYIITSNFHKLRLYIDHSDDFEEFDLFDMTHERFELFYYLLNKTNLFADIPLKLKEDSKLKEQDISNELYKKYAGLRSRLFENIVENNPDIEKLILLNKTQKLLDRMVFIFFAEDRGILPTNTIATIIEHYKNDIEDRALYHFYKIYFKAINEGNAKINITEYNGGLFAEDKILDALKIDDHVLDACPLALSAYDFNTDIDVNILGHIFENSLSDIEEMKADIENQEFDKTKTKRKKDGVFYTPEYITKYIVDNTLGKLCSEKKTELELDNIDINIPKTKSLNKGEKKILQSLEAYREYLLNLKILDPACGSGAFLNQALNFLLAEHDFIDEGIKILMGGNVLGLYDVKKGILENNLYGVDINSEAVEIAKLSLWLRTVEHGRKLNILSGKIKVGNSLIDDKSVADDAFVWEEEFSEVFEQGGFDCVIGNPPYVGEKGRKDIFRPIREVFKDRYEKNSDIFYFFFMKSIDILKEDGNFGFITTNYFLTADSAVKLRKELKERTAIYKLINFNEMKLFDSALGQHNIVTIFKKTKKILDTNIINVISPNNILVNELFTTSDDVEVFTVKSNELYDGDKNYIRVSKQGNSLENVFNKMTQNSKTIEDICFVNTGFNTGADRVTNSNLIKAYKDIPANIKFKSGIFILSKEEYKQIRPENDIVYRCYKSSDIERYSSYTWQKLYVIWTNKDTEIEKYPNIKNHLEKYRKFLELKREYHTGQIPWYSQHWAREYDVFGNKDKIVLPYRSKSNIFSYSDSEYFGSKDILYLRQKYKNFNIKYLLALLNSKLYYTWLYYKGKRKGEILELYVTPISQIPIKDISKEEQEPFIRLVNSIIESKEKIAKYKKHFDSLNAIDKIEIKEEIEKLEGFIDNSVNEIDEMVYMLYGLSVEEIKIVEGQ